DARHRPPVGSDRPQRAVDDHPVVDQQAGGARHVHVRLHAYAHGDEVVLALVAVGEAHAHARAGALGARDLHARVDGDAALTVAFVQRARQAPGEPTRADARLREGDVDFGADAPQTGGQLGADEPTADHQRPPALAGALTGRGV